jgi:hypothetical protein
VRDGHRHRAEAHDPRDAEVLDHLAHGARERLPPDVRLGAAQQQEGRAARVAQGTDDQARRLVVGVVVADEGHRWPPGAVVVERVDVEGGHHLALGQLGEVVRRELGRLARVEESGEHADQRQVTGVGQHLRVVHDVHESFGHGATLGRASP